MPEAPEFNRGAWPAWGRWLLIALALTALLALNYYDHSLQDWLTSRWQGLLASPTGLGRSLATALPTLPGSIAKRPLPVLLFFLGLYLSVAAGLLALLLPRRAWGVAFRFYAGLIGAYVLLLLLGKLSGGHAPWAHALGRLLVEMLGTPLPVLVLVVLLRYGQPARN